MIVLVWQFQHVVVSHQLHLQTSNNFVPLVTDSNVKLYVQPIQPVQLCSVTCVSAVFKGTVGQCQSAVTCPSVHVGINMNSLHYSHTSTCQQHTRFVCCLSVLSLHTETTNLLHIYTVRCHRNCLSAYL